MTRPGTYNIYKKKAALQISLIRSTFNDKGFLEKEGAVYLEATKAIGENADGNVIYDWNNKLKFAFGLNDIALLLDNHEKPLVHDYKGSIKTLQFQPGVGQYEGTFMVHLREKTGDTEEKKVSVGISRGESKILFDLIKMAPAILLNWI